MLNPLQFYIRFGLQGCGMLPEMQVKGKNAVLRFLFGSEAAFVGSKWYS
jgi:hypothetical protein